MWQQLWSAFVDQFHQKGIEAWGYLVIAFCFGLFYARGTQRFRFRWISRGCYALAIAGFCDMILPNLYLLNPQFLIPKVYLFLIHIFFLSLGVSYLWASFFVVDFSKKQLKIMFCVATMLQMGLFYVLNLFLPQYSFINWGIAVTWVILGVTFILTTATGRTAWFHMIGDLLVLLGIYYGLKQWDTVLFMGWIWVALVLLISFVVLISQIQFMGFNYEDLELQLEQEQKRRTLFWDLAPFPILVSKLLDDSVLYMNQMAQETLKISANDIVSFRLSDYFTDVEKRNELVSRVRQEQIVDSFEVSMKSPRTGEIIWLDLSARVVKMDGDLAMYINLHNVTQQKETEEKLFREASTDALTGLYNRRQFETLMHQVVATSRRYQTPYCLWMSDIDHFKHVNDTYGHEAGDIVLKQIADTLRSHLRESDIVGRFGGEEFIVMLPNTDLAGAKVAAENMRQAVQNLHIEAEGKIIPVTISIGVTDTQNGDLLQLTKEADTALYYAKEHGRNQVAIYAPDMKVQEQK